MTESFTRPSANRRLVMAVRPQGTPSPEQFVLETGPVPVPAEGQFLVRNVYLSPDPAQRGWFANPAMTQVGDVARSLAVGIVIDSREPGIKAGEMVYGFFGWQDYALARRSDLLSHVAAPRAPLSAYAGVLGMPGLTAWIALETLAPPKAGDRVLVSTAAGVVGSVVGQVARRAGAHVLGLTGSEDKIARCVSRYGYHAAFNYKTIDLAEMLKREAPDGVTLFFDNTGGAILDTTIRAMARKGRIIQCGTAATAVWTPTPTGLRNEREIMLRALSWLGFSIFDHLPAFPAAIEQMTDLLLAGELVHDEDIDEGLAQAPAALLSLFSGDNSGKKLVHIGAE